MLIFRLTKSQNSFMLDFKNVKKIFMMIHAAAVFSGMFSKTYFYSHNQ